MNRCAFLAVAIAIIGSTAAPAQPPGTEKTAAMVFSDARDLVGGGSFEVAADMLKEFLAMNPTAQDYLDLEAKFGPTTFLKLRTIPRWYDDPKRDEEFKTTTLETIVTSAIAANEALLKNPARIARFIRNLGGPPEEHDFAVAELRRSGDAVVPQLIEALRLDPDGDKRAGILRAIVELGPETIPGLLAAGEAMRDEFKLLILGAIARRADFAELFNTVDTNALPVLWYLSALPGDQPNSLRTYADAKLRELFAAGYERRNPLEELTNAAKPLDSRSARFMATDTGRTRVKLWTWDESAQTLSPANVDRSIAEEAFALKYLRWALERDASYEPARELALAIATERAVERINFGHIGRQDPAVFRLLAAAPAETLIRLLDRSLVEKRTALSLGLVQALGERAEPAAAAVQVAPGGNPRPPVLVKALDDPDPRVQLSAALALIRIPNAVHGANSRIVDVLRRAVAPDASPANIGRAIVADPSAVRGDQVANLLRVMGYQAEVVGTGRQLAQRLANTSEIDLILVDRHIVDPTLPDLMPQLRGSALAGRSPVFIVASADSRSQPALETMLVRLAALIAITETIDVNIPALPVADRRKTIDEIERERRAVVDIRDLKFQQLYELRLGRLQRLVEAANLRQSDELRRRLELRLPQLTMAAIAAQYDLTPTSAPKLMRDLGQLTELIRRQTDTDASVRGVDTADLVRLIRQLEAVLTPELIRTFDVLRTRLNDDALALAPDRAVDPATQAALDKLARTYTGAFVIREPYSPVGFREDVLAAMPDAASRPRDPVEKAESSLAAVKALTLLAVGDTPGYNVVPAADALRAALANDTLAIFAATALGRIGTGPAQTDLIKTAADNSRAPEIRRAASSAAIRNVRAFGKSATPEAITMLNRAAADEPAAAAELAVLQAAFDTRPGAFVDALREFRPTLPKPADKPKEEAEKPPEGENPKKDN